MASNPIDPFLGINQEVAPGANLEDFLLDSGNQTPSIPPYGQGSAPSAPLPLPSQPAPINAFQGAIDTVVEQMQTDTINSPPKPERAINPFRDPLVSLGFALQGKSAEAVQMGSQIELQNKRRMDAYNAQLFRAESYRQLRKQRLATTLAGLQAQAGRSVLEDDYRKTQAEISKARFETTEARLSAQNDATDTYRQAVLDAQNSARDRTASFTDYLEKDPVFKDAYLLAGEQLSTYSRLGKIVVGGKVVDLAAGGSADSKKAALELFTNDLYAISDTMRRMGFVEQGLAWEKEINLIVKDELATIDDTSIVSGGAGGPESITNIEQARQFKEASKAGPTRFSPDAALDDVGAIYGFLDESLQRKTIEDVAGVRDMTEAEQVKATRQGLSRRISEELGKDPTYLASPEGAADRKGFVDSIVDDFFASSRSIAPSWAETEQVITQELANAGIKPGWHGALLRRAKSKWRKFSNARNAATISRAR